MFVLSYSGKHYVDTFQTSKDSAVWLEVNGEDVQRRRGPTRRRKVRRKETGHTELQDSNWFFIGYTGIRTTTSEFTRKNREICLGFHWILTEWLLYSEFISESLYFLTQTPINLFLSRSVCFLVQVSGTPPRSDHTILLLLFYHSSDHTTFSFSISS